MDNIQPTELMLYGLFFVMAGFTLAELEWLIGAFIKLRARVNDRGTPWPVFILAMVVVVYVNWMAW